MTSPTRPPGKAGSSRSSATITTRIPRPSSKRIINLKDPRRVEFGPYQFITEKILHKLNSPLLRVYGVSHVALAWMSSDRNWTSEKGSANNNLASSTVPLLDRASPPASTEGGGGGGGRRAA